MQHGNYDCFKHSLILYVFIILLLWHSGKHYIQILLGVHTGQKGEPATGLSSPDENVLVVKSIDRLGRNYEEILEQ